MQVAHHVIVLAGPARWAPCPAWRRRRTTRLVRSTYPRVQGLASHLVVLGDLVEGVELLPPVPPPFRRPDRIDGFLAKALLTRDLPCLLSSCEAPFHTTKRKAISTSTKDQAHAFPSEKRHSGYAADRAVGLCHVRQRHTH